MGYLLFKCSDCDANLVLGDASIGNSCVCPSCHGVVQAPYPAISFPCTVCKCVLFAPEKLRQGSFVCPNCETRILIPKNTILLCPSCSAYLEIDDEYYAEVAGREVECPQCRISLSVPRMPLAMVSVMNQQGGMTHSPKTLRLDRLVAGIPQLHSLEHGHCPYCSTRLEKDVSGDGMVCKRCRRVLSTLQFRRGQGT